MSDSALHELLDAHARGDLDDDALLEAVPRPIRAAGAAAARAAVMAAGDRGRLAPALLERLLDEVERTAGAEAHGDATRVLPGGTGGPAPPPARGNPQPEADADKTRVLPGGTAAVAQRRAEGTSPSVRTGAGGESPTQGETVAADDDSTLAAEKPGDTPSTTGRTERPGVEVEDATAVVAANAEPITATALAAASDPSGELGAGDEIKGRFRLLERLGQGGMGTIWKAVDKRREEARDRNPYIAIKLLAGDFKNHPEAFIALQRECAKQQRLAHPNIATVYDFDRDGETVYMTMVL